MLRTLLISRFSIPPSYALLVALFCALGWSLATRAADDSAAKKQTPSAVPALAASLKTNLDYCQQWFDGKDFKTLAQTASGVTIVADALARKSDDATAAACKSISTSASALEGAARNKNADLCRTELGNLRQKIAELKPVAAPAPVPSGKPPAASMRSAMDLLEGTLGDAKTSAATGDLDSARTNAQVLAELAELLSNYKSDARWKGWSEDFARTSRAVAASDSTDPSAVKQLLKEVSLSCERCHKKR